MTTTNKNKRILGKRTSTNKVALEEEKLSR